MRNPDGPRHLLRTGVLDSELAALLWLLIEARTPLVVVSPNAAAAAVTADGLAAFLPAGASVRDVAPDDDFAWLPEAVELGWRHERPLARGDGARDGDAITRLRSPDGVMTVRRLASPGGVTGARARIVVRALALGYGLVATMDGGGLDAAFEALHAPDVGTDPDERSRLGLVLAVDEAGGAPRVVAAHYVRPVAYDTHHHVQRLPPAVLATWNEAAGRWDHFAWGVAPDLAGRLGLRPIELEREQARRALALRELAAGG